MRPSSIRCRFQKYTPLPRLHDLIEREFQPRRAPYVAHPQDRRFRFPEPFRVPVALVEYFNKRFIENIRKRRQPVAG